MRKRVTKKLRRRLGLWWIEPIDETLRELGKPVPKHIPSPPMKKMPEGFKPRIERI
jgi:hypothetical protein